MTPEELKAIEQRAEAATEGPWEADTNNCLNYSIWTKDLNCGPLIDGKPLPLAQVYGTGLWGTATANALFVCKARTDVPALIAEVRRLQAENERLTYERNPLFDRLDQIDRGEE